MEKKITCPGCGQVSSAEEVAVSHKKSGYGPVIERRCTNCNTILAAYLEGEGNFLPRIRKF
ncbi:hypothetical protein ACFLXO_07065 [Chloroflexota bacterium]